MTTETEALVAFLTARYDETEAAALAASPGGWVYSTVESVGGGALYDETRTIANVVYEQPGDHDGRIVRHLLSGEANRNGEHIARHDPAAVLADIEAKRRIVERYAHLAESGDSGDGRWVLPLLALPFAGHAGYDPTWEP